MTYQFWHDFAGPLATVFASIVALVVTIHFGRTQAQIAREQSRIAQQQAELAEIRLRHDLYDRRFPIFGATSGILAEILSSGKISGEKLSDFLQQRANATFLLNDDVSKYLEDFADKALLLIRTQRRLADANSEARQEKLADEEAELTLWFAKQSQVVREKFVPFLVLDRSRRSKRTD